MLALTLNYVFFRLESFRKMRVCNTFGTIWKIIVSISQRTEKRLLSWMLLIILLCKFLERLLARIMTPTDKVSLNSLRRLLYELVSTVERTWAFLVLIQIQGRWTFSEHLRLVSFVRFILKNLTYFRNANSQSQHKFFSFFILCYLFFSQINAIHTTLFPYFIFIEKKLSR